MNGNAPFLPDVHALILSLDEELHIARWIESLKGQCASVTVIDSGSSDATIAIARELEASVRTNRWINHAPQMNFAIDALAGKTVGCCTESHAERIRAGVRKFGNIAQADTAASRARNDSLRPKSS